jgi:hypothetical protein
MGAALGAAVGFIPGIAIGGAARLTLVESPRNKQA